MHPEPVEGSYVLIDFVLLFAVAVQLRSFVASQLLSILSEGGTRAPS